MLWTNLSSPRKADPVELYHYIRDVTFGEDRCSSRVGNAPANNAECRIAVSAGFVLGNRNPKNRYSANPTPKFNLASYRKLW